MTHWDELVELYEYRVADVLAGRTPRGGRRALLGLRRELLDAPLEPGTQRRLIEADRRSRGVSRGAPPAPRAPALGLAPAPAAAWSSPIAVTPREALAWDELRRMAWRTQVMVDLRAHGARWSRELNLLTLRVLYTAAENAARLDAAGGLPPLSVPAAADPLLDLLDPGVQSDLLETVADLLASAGGDVRLRAALSELHESPFARHPDEDVLAARVAAVERERRTAEERAGLIRALHEQYPLPRDPRERPAIREAVRALGQSLDLLLAGAPTPSRGSVPPHRILYAAQPDLALPGPDDAAEELVVALPGGQAASWRGVAWRWQFIHPNWQLQADRQVLLLRPSDPAPARQARLDTARGPFMAFLSGDHVLLRAEVSPEHELAQRAALGRALALLLTPGQDYAALRLARAAARLLRGLAPDPEASGPASALTYRLASPEALLGFARRGLQTLAARLDGEPPGRLDAALRQAARVTGVGEAGAERLAETLRLAWQRPEPLGPPVTATRAELPGDGAFLSLHLPDEPLTLLAAARAVTLRPDFQGRLAAVMPGHAAQYLQDLLVLRLPGQSVILARHGRWIAAAAVPDGAESGG